MDYGVPPLAEKNRSLIEQRLEERGAVGLRETLTVELSGRMQPVEVVDMPIDAVYFNPGTHRIRAQRNHKPDKDSLLDADPWSAPSQDYLHHLLQALPADPAKRDTEFDKLKKSLAEYGQSDPGLITREGILVNGNTRVAALRELGKTTHIRVGVLPASSTWDEIVAVELSLQMYQDHRREYSYINKLLAHEEQLHHGRTEKEIARQFRTTEDVVKRDLWILDLLRDLIDRSREGGAALRLLDFEDHQESLRELSRAYMDNVAAKRREAAERLKEGRIAGILLDLPKTDLRLIGSDFRERYLDRHLPVDLRPEEESAGARVEIPGLGASVSSGRGGAESASRLTDALLRARAADSSAGLLDGSREAGRVLNDVKQAFKKSLKPARSDSNRRKKERAASDRIDNARTEIEQCEHDISMAAGANSLDEEAFDESLLKLRDSLGSMAVKAARHSTHRGEGMTWLLNMCVLDDEDE